jgi:hypothetical protein
MITLSIDPIVLNTLQQHFPKPARSAEKALNKYLALLTDQLHQAEAKGRSFFEIDNNLFYISVNLQRHKGGQIGTKKVRLQNWLEDNHLNLFEVLEVGSNFSNKLSLIKLTKLVHLNSSHDLACSDAQVGLQKTDIARLYPDLINQSLDSPHVRAHYDILPINQQSLTNYLHALDHDTTTMTASQRRCASHQAQFIAGVAEHFNGLYPQRKKPSAFGRIYYEGLSAQNVKKDVRQAMLGGCWEYDVTSSVFCWKMLYARDCVPDNASHDIIEQTFYATIHYITHKHDFIETVRYYTFDSDSELTIDRQNKYIKQAITALGFGARIHSEGWALSNGEWVNSSIADIFKNAHELERFRECPLVHDFVCEQKQLDDCIFHRAVHDQPVCFGDADVYTQSGRFSKAKVIAYMYQTYETTLMNYLELLIKGSGKQIIARIHDAIVIKPNLTESESQVIHHMTRKHVHNPYFTLSQRYLKPCELPSSSQLASPPDSDKHITNWVKKFLTRR